MKVINLLSGPRNISTALMYSFAQRDDTKVMDEPFYGYYLSQSSNRVKHPSQEEIIKEMELDLKRVVKSINQSSESQNVFVKGMAHHMIMDEPDFMLNWTNVILIRHPKKLIASFSKVIPDPNLTDIGIAKAAALFQYLKSHGNTPVVIDSDELMVDPENYLRKLCRILNIPFDAGMLSWEQGGIPEDGLWAKHWYRNVHQTTGFQVQQRKPANIATHLGPLLAQALTYYNELKENILKND